MGYKTDNIVRDLRQIVMSSSRKKTSAYDTSATVTRVDGDVMYVQMPGSTEETPVKRTVNASVGDTVQVRVSGHVGFVVGNATSPPTDDTLAQVADNNAKFAAGVATNAQNAAETAALQAEKAINSANEAAQAADEAKESAQNAREDAEDAKNSATSARVSADNALAQLSIIEDVSGTLNWISEHGSYIPTTDTSVSANTIYFERVGGEYIPIASPDQTANPSEEGWYILDITDSQSAYIMAHLAVTSAGLWVLPNNAYSEHYVVDSNGDKIVDSNGHPIVDYSLNPQVAEGYKVLLSNSGMTVFNPEGIAVASYGATIRIGKDSEMHVDIIPSGMKVINSYGDLVASFGETAQIGKNSQMHAIIGPDGMDVVNSDDEPVASFGETTQIGRQVDSHIKMDYRSLSLMAYNEEYGMEDTYFKVIDFRDKDNDYLAPMIDIFIASGTENYYDLSAEAADTNYTVTVDGDTSGATITTKDYDSIIFSQAPSQGAKITVQYETDSFKARALTFGGRQGSALGGLSSSFGRMNVVTGYCASAHGEDLRAQGNFSHSEGKGSKAYGEASHAEGRNTQTLGRYSHAEGENTEAKGWASHAGGVGTVAKAMGQTAVGYYNVEDGVSLLIVGNGSNNNSRSNAFTLDASGNETISGTLTQSSDRRLKDHIDYLDEDAIRFIQKLKPAHYIKDDEHHVGFYAQDVEEVDEWDCMTGEMNGYMTLGYTEIIAPLVRYCQSLEARIAELEKRG